MLMKKYVLLGLMIFTFCGCATEQENVKMIVFENQVTAGDIWILPQTQENLKTTVWGKATISMLETNQSQEAMIEDGEGLYIFRMIDSEKFFYSADNIELEEGWTMVIKEKDIALYQLEVFNEKGTLVETYEVFGAKL